MLTNEEIKINEQETHRKRKPNTMYTFIMAQFVLKRKNNILAPPSHLPATDSSRLYRLNALFFCDWILFLRRLLFCDQFLELYQLNTCKNDHMRK